MSKSLYCPHIHRILSLSLQIVLVLPTYNLHPPPVSFFCCPHIHRSLSLSLNPCCTAPTFIARLTFAESSNTKSRCPRVWWRGSWNSECGNSCRSTCWTTSRWRSTTWWSPMLTRPDPTTCRSALSLYKSDLHAGHCKTLGLLSLIIIIIIPVKRNSSACHLKPVLNWANICLGT